MRNFAEVNAYLDSLMPETRSRRVAYTLDNMRSLMQFLGNPQNSYKTVHVAGTSGKSSTCYYLSEMLAGTGRKIGLMTSPHVDEINERVQINTHPLAEAEFCREFSVFLQQVEASGVRPTYFEIMVAFAFWEFWRQKVDYAVVEVGLGGLLDGTNVINHDDKVCVISDIGFDHMATLGNTLPEIAYQKAGIILVGNPVFTHQQPPEIMEIISQTCQQKQADLHIVTQQPSPGNLPLFQKRNWDLAHQAFNYLVERDGLGPLTNEQLETTARLNIPARMEVRHIGGKTVILDGAHNPQKLQALVESLDQSFPDQPKACLVAFSATGNSKVSDELQILLPHISSLIATSFHDAAAEKHSVDPEEIARQSQALSRIDCQAKPDIAKALQKLLQRPEKILLVTGSFFLIQKLRPLIMSNHDTPDRSN